MPPETLKAKRGQVFIAPVGTPFSAGGWEPIGHTTTDGLITAGTITAKSITAAQIAARTIPIQKLDLTDELFNLYYGAIPQRYIAGLPRTTTQETPLGNPRTFTNSINASVTVDNNGIYSMIKVRPSFGSENAVILDKHLPSLVNALFKNSSKFGRMIKDITLDGKPSVKVGEGSLAGIVYKPTTEEQATRNLNFALANLAAYVEWDEKGRELAEKREAALKAAEKRVAEEKKRREEQEAKAAAERAAHNRKRRDALDFYNLTMRTSHYSWSQVGLIGEARIQQWIDLSEAAKNLKTVTSPLGGSTLRPASLYPSPFGGYTNFRL